MSLKQTQWVWQLTLKPGPKLVLLALADYANDQGECYPSLKQLQKKCGFARSTLLVHLRWLRNKKFISVKNQHDKNGYRRRNLYQIDSIQGPNSESPSPDFGPSKVQNLDGNNINGHLDSQYNRGPKSGPRKFHKIQSNKSALEGAI